MESVASAPLWPVQVNVQGGFEMCANLSEGWQQRVKALLTTRMGERVMRLDYGCSLADALFDQLGSLTPESAVRQAMAKWLPRLTVNSVEVTYEGSLVDVRVIYTTPSGSTEEVVAAFLNSGEPS